MVFSNKTWWITIALITGLGAALRWPLLNGSFWLDEAAQAIESTRPWSQQLDIAADFQPPLFHLLVAMLSQVSYSEAWLRLASLLPGLGSIVLLAIIGRRLFSPQVGILAAVMMSISSLMIFFSQELRPYMFAVFWAELSWLSWLEWRVVPRWRTQWFWLLCGSLLAGIFTSYVFIFWWISLWIFSWKSSLKFGYAFTILSLVTGLFFLTWWPWFWEQWLVGQDLRLTLPGWEQVVSIPQVKALPLLLGKFLVGILPLDISALHVSLLAIWYGGLAVCVGMLWKKGKTGEKNGHFWELCLLLILAVGITWLFSWFTPVLAPKRVLFLLPVLILLVAALAERIKIAQLLVGLFMVVNAVGVLRYWNEPSLQRENWKQVVETIEADFSAQNTVVIFAFDQPFAPWRWYVTEPFTTISTGLSPLTQTTDLQTQLIQRSPQNVIVFDYLRDLTDPNGLILLTLDELDYLPGEVYDQPNIGFVRVYQRATLYAGRTE